MWVCASSAHYCFWRPNKLLFLVAWSRGLHFWRESKINSRGYWRCVLSRWVLPQQREVQIYWWLCNNFEIHLWLWQMWSLVVCSQSTFHVTRARKDDRNGQNTLFLCYKRCYTTNNCAIKSLLNQPIIERNNWAWITMYEKLSEMCFVPHVETKSVFTFQPINRLVSTTVKSAKLAATFWIFFLRTKNRQFCCLVVTAHIVLQERRVATTKNHLLFWRIFSANHSQAYPNLFQKKTNRVQIWN